jgi:hypothetical protein
MIIQRVEIMGMALTVMKHKSCHAEFGEGEDEHGKWATLYSIESKVEGQGHATQLLTRAMDYYQNVRFGGWVALNDNMQRIYQRLKIKEYTE